MRNIVLDHTHHRNPLLEEFLTHSNTRWGNLTGKALKSTCKAAARAAADEFSKTQGAPRHRDVFRSRLEGAAINAQVAYDIAQDSEVVAH